MPNAVLLALLSAAPVAFPPPQPATLDNCARAACTALNEVRACKCISPVEGNPVTLVVDRPGDSRVLWEGNAHLGDVADFLVSAVDLDADGKPELLVASRAADSSGLVIRTWNVAVVDGDKDGAAHFVSHDWGADAVSPKGTLLATEWEAGPADKDGVQPMYFVGREYAYAHGRLAQTKEPVRKRRLDAAFEAERQALVAASKDLTLAPRKLLSHASTQKLPADAPAPPLNAAVVKGVTRHEPGLDVHLEQVDGALASLSSDGEEGPLLRLGDVKARRLWPLGYSPDDAADWLLGKKALVAVSQGKSTGVVWLQEK